MPDLVVETPEGVSLRYEIAGAGSRTAAGLLDLAIFLIVWLSLTAIVLVVSMVDATGVSSFAVGLLGGGMLVLPAIYQIAFALSWNGQTPGKRLAGIRVADANGFTASPMQHVMRGLFWPFEAILLIFPIPFALILMVATERSQRLGDLVAGTVVLREPKPQAQTEPFKRDVWSKLPKHTLPLVPALAARLDSRDYRVLRSILGRSDLDSSARSRLHRRAARLYLQRLGMEDRVGDRGTEPRQVLREIYLFLRELRGMDPATRRATPPPEEDAGVGRGNARASAAPLR